MAEIMGAAAAVLAVVQLTNSSAKIIISLSNASKTFADDRYDELYWRMFAEKQSMVALLTQIKTSGRPLSPENIKTFDSLLAQLTITHKKMERALQRLLPEDGKATLRSLATRLKFDRGGFDELKQRMSSIEAMTRALKLLGETLPGYTPRPEEQSSATPTVSRTSMATDHPVTGATGHEGQEPQDQPAVQQEPLLREIPLASLCHLCEEAMLELSTHPELRGIQPRIAALLARLELWAIGVWDSSSGLMDKILQADPERHEFVGTFVARSLVNIAVALEDIFRAIQQASKVQDAERPVSKSRRALLAALGTGNLVDAAIERWSVLAMSLEDEEADAADADTIGASEVSPDSFAMTGKSFDSAVSSALEDIEVTLESLSSINSSIRSIRSSYRLDMESARAEIPSVVGSPVGVDPDTSSSEEPWISSEKQKEYVVLRVVSKDKATQRLMREETVQLVKQLEDALNNDEAADPGAGGNMRLLSPEVKTQRLKLEEFERQSREMPPDKLRVAVDLNQTLKKTLNSVIVGGDRDGAWKSKPPLLYAGETDKILDRTMETLGNAVETITQ